MKRIVLAFAVLALTVCCTMGSALADYPERPITFICPWGAGGGTDSVSRMVATLLKGELGQPVNVVNRTGGSGVVGHSAIAMARADGYTIGMPTVELNMMHWMGLTKLSPKDYTAIGMVNMDDAAIFVKKGGKYGSYEELVAAIKDGKGKLTASGSGHGSIWHLALAGWLVKMGLPANAVKWVPSKGSASGLQDMLADGIDFVCCSVPEGGTLLEAGKIEGLAVMGEKRYTGELYKSMPTLKEKGLDWTTSTWRGVAGPKGMPVEVVAKLDVALANVAKSKEFIDFMANRGYGLVYKNAAEFGAMMDKSDKEFGEVMKAANLAK